MTQDPQTKGWWGRTDGRRGCPRFLVGIVCGLFLLFTIRLIVNSTELPDRFLSPLLLSDTIANADAIVVMGAGVVGDCRPNQNGVGRVLLAARLWREKRAPIVVFTGGSGEGCPVAAAMAQLAREVGVDESSIVLETASRSTRENGDLTAPILRRLAAHRILVVTDRLHMRRSAGTFVGLGFDVMRASVPVYIGHPDNMSMLTAGLRELAAVGYYRLRGWLPAGTPDAWTAPIFQQEQPEIRSREGVLMREGLKYPLGPVVILGASYAEGWQPRLSGVPVVTRGASGQQSFEMLQRFERDVVSQNPRAVVLWGFINDFFRSSPQDADRTSARIRDSYTRMIELSRANGIEPILATEVTVRPRDTWTETLGSWVGWLRGKEGHQERVNAHVLAANRWLTDLAEREGLLLLDLQRVLADTNGRRRREFAQEDGSHITAAGYAALTAYATPILERHFGVPQGGQPR